MSRIFVCGILIVSLLCACSPGMRPRADASSYPAHQERSDCAIGAALIPPDQAKKIFLADLHKAGYVVVEIGVFPKPGNEVDLFPTDFTLFVGDNLAALRPVDPGPIAESIAHPESQSPRSRSDVGLSADASIGHVTYLDPATGRKSGATIVTTDAGVGVGGPAPNSPAPPAGTRSRTRTARAIEQELWEKSLPDGKVTHAVAGYLYFPKPSGKAKDAARELRYENSGGRARLPLPR